MSVAEEQTRTRDIHCQSPIGGLRTTEENKSKVLLSSSGTASPLRNHVISDRNELESARVETYTQSPVYPLQTIIDAGSKYVADSFLHVKQNELGPTGPPDARVTCELDQGTKHYDDHNAPDPIIVQEIHDYQRLNASGCTLSDLRTNYMNHSLLNRNENNYKSKLYDLMFFLDLFAKWERGEDLWNEVDSHYCHTDEDQHTQVGPPWKFD